MIVPSAALRRLASALEKHMIRRKRTDRNVCSTFYPSQCIRACPTALGSALEVVVSAWECPLVLNEVLVAYAYQSARIPLRHHSPRQRGAVLDRDNRYRAGSAIAHGNVSRDPTKAGLFAATNDLQSSVARIDSS